MEEYYYWVGNKQWYPIELQTKLLSIYGQGPSPFSWTEQDIFEGSKQKTNFDYFKVN